MAPRLKASQRSKDLPSLVDLVAALSLTYVLRVRGYLFLPSWFGL